MVLNVRQLVNIVLDTTSLNYTLWRDLMLMTLTRYSLADHIEFDDAFPKNGRCGPLLAHQHNHPGSPSGHLGAWLHCTTPVPHPR
jgi:hypothetical protein